MVPNGSTRREVLAVSGFALAGFAGCGARSSERPDSGVGGDGSETASPTATERSYANAVSEPERRTLRNPAGNPAVRSSAHEPGPDPTPTNGVDEPSAWIHEHWFVTGQEERNAMEYSGSTDGVEPARAFVAETEFSEASVLVQQYAVGECTTVDVRRIRWSEVEDGPPGAIDLRVDYDDSEREGDCETDAEHGSGHDNEEQTESIVVAATITRIPVPVETVRSFSYQL